MVCSRNSSCELRQNDIKHAYDQIKMFDTIDKSLNDSNDLLDDYNDILSSNAKKKKLTGYRRKNAIQHIGPHGAL